jgi:hypothetical protein
MRAEEVVKERELDATIERYAAQKAAVEEERCRVVAERAAVKEAHRQRMVAIMEANFMQVSGDCHGGKCSSSSQTRNCMLKTGRAPEFGLSISTRRPKAGPRAA